MADTPTPYVRKDPGDIMLAADWNQMQVRARQEIQAHDHSGDPFQQIPREGIREKAIDGSRIDPDAKVALKGLTVSGPLKITGTSQLADIKAALASFTGARLTTAGDLGVGTDAPENAEGWSRVVDILGGAHAKLAVRAGDVDARVMAHTTGIYGGEPGMLVGTRSGHPLSLVQAGTVRARLATATAQGGSETGLLDLFPAGSPLRISHGWTSFPDANALAAEICNDTQIYKTLMLVGNRSNGGVRRVSVWDRLEVNGPLTAQGVDVSAGVPDHISTDGSFYRWGGQVYLNVDDNLYVRDSQRGIRMHFDTTNGVFKTDVLRLGDKWRMSAIGDAHGNDGWLRLFNVQNTGYFGGLAAGELWSGKALQVSDRRLKDNVREIGDALDKLSRLHGVHFDWREGAPSGVGRPAAGLIAQDVEGVLPEAVALGPDGWKGIDTTAVLALLVQAVKEQQVLIQRLRDELATRA
ncbi:MAG TPA: tail fiber domain-containing protein [Rhodocyclaceae bacterium]|nr:tail fiber domain-containing protein [Rhodocyclaceae bacterium]